MRSATKLAASAPDYPGKPVRIIEPFGAGGGPDLLARALAPKLSELWGQPVTVENIPGAGATAGPAQVAKSPADGRTLLINTNAQAYSAGLSKDLPYDPLKDFIPVIPLTRQAYVLVAGKAPGVTTVGELIAAAKARPGELKFGSTGIGTGTHVGVEKFNQAAGIKALHVLPSPNDSNADTIVNAIAGRFNYYLVPISLVLPHIRDGTLVALGVSTARRSTLLPQVPTIAEAGVVGFNFPIWYGMWVPAGTPSGVVDKLANDVGRVLAGADLPEWIARHGGEPMSMTQPEFARFVESESEATARLMEAASVKS
ncbi:Bug family tripartite tricarboxylate transporter substrate binding protein [Sinorhizobium chiapasense]|uniref:Tripartite tricarboxylate transporter substrate-binding protein n=1 Tax=Sinorhizobium chiapasense TaxID=501572 RepID=A0ABZ2BH85_9HYPH